MLHGTWGGAAGKPARAGSVVTFGDRPGGGSDETIMIHFESGSPITPDVDGTIHFICDLSHPAWGPGSARGTMVVDGGVRNVLTFPPSLP